jgi:hypothetical protein
MGVEFGGFQMSRFIDCDTCRDAQVRAFLSKVRDPNFWGGGLPQSLSSTPPENPLVIAF